MIEGGQAATMNALVMNDGLQVAGMNQYQKRWSQYEVSASSQEDERILDLLEDGIKDDRKEPDVVQGSDEQTNAGKVETPNASQEAAKDSKEPTQAEEKKDPHDLKIFGKTVGRRTPNYQYKDNAFDQYAMAKGIDRKDVALTMIENDGGMQKWAFIGIDLGSQGKLRQCLRAELRKECNKEQQEVYKLLGPEMQESFAAAWGEHRDWKFLTNLKTHEQATETTTGKRRAWFTPTGLAAFLGSASDTECQEQAANWNESCFSYKDPKGYSWFKWSHGLRTYLFLYEWEIEKEDEVERHSIKAEVCSSENLFKKAATERKAVLNYAQQHGKKESQVTLDDVRKHHWGIEGWANANANEVAINVSGGRRTSTRGLAREDSDLPSVGRQAPVAPKAKAGAKDKVKAKANAKPTATGAKLGDVDKEMKKNSCLW